MCINILSCGAENVQNSLSALYNLGGLYTQHNKLRTLANHVPRQTAWNHKEKSLAFARSRYLARCHNYSVVHISVCFKSWFVRQSCSVLWDSSRVTTNANGTLFLVSHHSWCTAHSFFTFISYALTFFSLFMTPLFMFMLLERWWKLFSLFILAPISLEYEVRHEL